MRDAPDPNYINTQLSAFGSQDHSNVGETIPGLLRSGGISEGNNDHKFDFIVLAKNARIHTNDRIVQVLAELENEAWDIVLFSETRAATNMVILDGGHAVHEY